MTEPEIIDHVAKAIRISVCNRSKIGRPWEALSEEIRKQWRDDAAAAIRAYRETQTWSTEDTTNALLINLWTIIAIGCLIGDAGVLIFSLR